ncbi:autotransporter domain-containing protein [Thalassospira sp. TSL5-1]|uniref:autotransporter domain-containing protein n=1 Tax=Thalassospira sp. TSL5-1 TaxID=1544451 RepID=UPI00093EA0A5|nr:autotransporter domain-containing protein [Thalassospira sp. TSL5-1]OKH89423.1 hypothetical protein LF95_05415 [Thalassospira sp. TSL5-1]
MLSSSSRKTTLILLATVATDILCLHGPALAENLFLSTGSHTVSGTETYEQLRLGVAPTSGNTVLNIGTGAILNSGTREGSTAKETFVGIDTGANSIVNVTGPNAVWNDNGTALLIGYLGEGKVNISSGGKVSAYHVKTSPDAGTGSISITDSGSKLKSESHIGFKKGTFEVKNGAELETVSGGIYLNSATFTASGNGTNIKIGTAHSGTPASFESADGYFSVESGTATISDGVTLESDAGYVNGHGVGDENKASMTVTGENTTWNAHLALYVGGSGNGPSNNTGELTISGGAQVWASTVGVGNDLGSTGSILVTGSDTKLSSISDTFSGKGYIGVDGTGTITVQNGATFSMADVLRMGFTADANGTLNIGADAASTAVAAGTVTATNGVEFYGGTSTIIFNHTETDYEFANAMVSKEDGKGTVRNIAGKTRLTANSSGFSGNVSLEGGTLTLGTSSAIGTSKLTVSGGTLGLADGANISNAIDLANATLSVEVLSGNAALSGTITNTVDPVNLEKTGAGNLTLSQDQTYNYIKVGNGGLTFDNNTTTAAGLFVGGEGQESPSLTAQNGSILNITSMVIGTFDPSVDAPTSIKGNLILKGQGTKLNTSLTARIDNGSLEVLDGAHFHSKNTLAIGMPTPGKTGVVTASGSGSQITTDGGITIGVQGGNGELYIKEAATANITTGITIAQDKNTTGKISVSGSGTLVDLADGALYVGSKGDGTLDISDGAVFEAGLRVEVGSAVGSSGRLNISGSGSTLKMTNDGTAFGTDYYLSIGTYGSDGITSVTNGGKIADAQKIIAGFVEGSAGTLIIDGADSSATSTIYTMIGYKGSGQATLSNGGKLTVSDSTRGVYIGYDTGSSGVLNIGAAEGSDPAASAGIVDASNVIFGNGTGSLVFKHTTENYDFTSNISGAGAIKILAGDTTLSGNNNNFTGSTTLSGGTLSVASAANLGAGSLVLDGGTLASTGSFTRAQDVTLNANKNSTINTAGDTALTLSGIVSGTGSLTKTGTGQLFLTGNNTYSGNTTVNQGSFGGTGTLGALSVLSGAIHAPGNNSIGTQTINGNYTLNSGSTLKIEVNDTGNMDKVVVQNNGTVALGGATLSIVGLQGNFAQNDYSQIIIDNQGASAITGTFASVTDDLAFYDATVTYTAGTGNDVSLKLKRNTTGYADVASTPNQKAVASVLSGLEGADNLLNNILSLSEAGVKEAYTQLTGNIYPITQQASINLNQQVSQQVGTRLTTLRTSTNSGSQAGLAFSAAEMAGFAQPQGMIDVTQPLSASLGWSNTSTTSSSDKAPNGLWSQTVGGRGIIDADGESVKTGYDWLGIIGGYDRAITPDITLGAFFGYINGNSEQSAIRSKIDTDTFTAGMYGEYRKNDWRASAQLAWSRVASDSRRDLKIGGFDQSATASYTDQSLSADAELARTFQVEQTMWFEPYVSASVLQQYLGDFAETGAPGANLARDDDTNLVGTSSIGVRFSTEYDVGNNKKLLPQLGLALKHHIGSTDNSSTLHFTAGGSDFVVNGTPKDRNMLTAKIGSALKFGDSFQAFASYNPSFGAKQTEHSFILGGRFEW